MTSSSLKVLLADDDLDDCYFFKEALDELPVSTNLATVHDGVQLMQWLSAADTALPDALFLDLNMPCKSGIECLVEIKANDKLANLPVIIYSTSLNMEVVDLLYQHGAHYYICKPGEFSALKNVILEAIQLISQDEPGQPSRDHFILQP